MLREHTLSADLWLFLLHQHILLESVITRSSLFTKLHFRSWFINLWIQTKQNKTSWIIRVSLSQTADLRNESKWDWGQEQKKRLLWKRIHSGTDIFLLSSCNFPVDFLFFFYYHWRVTFPSRHSYFCQVGWLNLKTQEKSSDGNGLLAGLSEHFSQFKNTYPETYLVLFQFSSS